MLSELEETDILCPDPEKSHLINVYGENGKVIGQIDIEREEIVRYVPVPTRQNTLEITMRCRAMEERDEKLL
jgi:hypothetical protein